MFVRGLLVHQLSSRLKSITVVYVTGGAASKLSKIRVVRKNIARSDRDQSDGQRAVLCVALSPSTRLPSSIAGANYAPTFALKRPKKCLPTDIRYKKTRAMRRALTKHEASIKSAKQLAITATLFSTALAIRLIESSFQAKKCLPTDIRYKKTRAMRRALTKHEASIKSAKQQGNVNLIRYKQTSEGAVATAETVKSKFNDIRNSSLFKSFESKLGIAYISAKMTASTSIDAGDSMSGPWSLRRLQFGQYGAHSAPPPF
ncbi:hypothetical protein PRIPAC_92240 [Pristionchus pacificus]|uniref:Large ribosomal subunit protein uL29 n=1 Tax=Pristionchus pacificus TaxID=54126 RepID=A0A2A6CDM6_PRIPA|nr:hypothetical protein PRIPAC_92240 [Pristionchus pacificus]|eukprot:PDM76188.1 hypothetical protein PRIPAC_39792 [Pristionchus pacificus]